MPDTEAGVWVIPAKVRLLLADIGADSSSPCHIFRPQVRERFAGLAYAGSDTHLAGCRSANSPTILEYGTVADG